MSGFTQDRPASVTLSIGFQVQLLPVLVSQGVPVSMTAGESGGRAAKSFHSARLSTLVTRLGMIFVLCHLP
jgi:hypothetical protein